MQTPLEVSGGAETSLLGESEFLEALSNATGRVSIHNYGTSPQGNPLVVVGVSTSPPPRPHHSTLSRSLLVGGSLHSTSEPSGREGSLTFIRDLAETADQAVLEQIENHPVWIIPTWNPDAHIDLNTNHRNFLVPSVDPNRDLIRLDAAESRAWATVINAVKPAVVINTHDDFSRSTPNIQLNARRYDSELGANISDLCDGLLTHLFAVYAENNVTYGVYPSTVTSQNTLNAYSAFRSAVHLLTEIPATQKSLTYRANLQTLTMHSALHWMRVNETGLKISRISNESRIVLRSQESPFWPVNSSITAEAVGYVVTYQPITAAERMDAHGVAYQIGPEGDLWVPLTHPTALVAVQMFDPDSDVKLSTGIRQTVPPTWASSSQVRQPSGWVPVSSHVVP